MSILVVKAAAFARTRHGAQSRKYTGEPYWHHLQEVATILVRHGMDDLVVAAGWLHDVLEDTRTRHAELADLFGANVADLVTEVTDVSRPEMGSRGVRKTVDRQYLAGASASGQAIKCADVVSNTAHIAARDLQFAKVYLPEKAKLMAVLTRAGERYPLLWEEAQQSVDRAWPLVFPEGGQS